VTVFEVDSVTSSTPSSTSRLFRGDIAISSDPASQGARGDAVWVQDGDILAGTYHDGSGDVLDSDTVTVDAVVPVISNVLPADDTFMSLENPTVVFDVTDGGSGIDSTGLGITLGVKVGTAPATPAQNISFQPIQDGVRAIFAQGLSWKHPPRPRAVSACGIACPSR
jgi:hypothetical protein